MSKKSLTKSKKENALMGVESRFQCYRMIIEKVKSCGEEGISKADLITYLEKENFVFSKYTFRRRMRDIHNLLDIGLYDPNKKRYIIYEEDLKDIDNLLNFLERNTFIQSNNSKLPLNRSTFNCFAFEKHEHFRGIENVNEIVDAITNHKKVSFNYKRYEPKTKTKTVVLCPFLLKEYQGRWYICGYEDLKEPMRHFCLDRITDFKVQYESFEPIKLDPKDPFNNVLGITIKKTKHVELKFSTYQAQYIIALPWHHTQNIVQNDSRFVTFSFDLAENYELVQRILMYGSEVKVLKPKSLVNWVKRILIRTVSNYD